MASSRTTQDGCFFARVMLSEGYFEDEGGSLEMDMDIVRSLSSRTRFLGVGILE